MFLVKETISSFGDAKCFPVRAVRFREGKNEMCFVLTSLFHFFTTKSFRQAIRLDFSITSYFIMFFNDHLFLRDLHFLCRCFFTMKRTHIHSPKEKDYLVGGVSLYLSLLQNFWSRYTSTLLRPAPLSWKTKKTLHCGVLQGWCLFFSVQSKNLAIKKKTWYQLIHHNPAWFCGFLKFEKLIN